MKEIYEKIRNYFPHHIDHGVITLLIAVPIFISLRWLYSNPVPVVELAIMVGLTAGFWFYVGREVAQWQEVHRDYFDWPGVLYPFYVATSVFLVFKLLQLITGD